LAIQHVVPQHPVNVSWLNGTTVPSHEVELSPEFFLGIVALYIHRKYIHVYGKQLEEWDRVA